VLNGSFNGSSSSTGAVKIILRRNGRKNIVVPNKYSTSFTTDNKLQEI
jgi:hypothetical protein